MCAYAIHHICLLQDLFNHVSYIDYIKKYMSCDLQINAIFYVIVHDWNDKRNAISLKRKSKQVLEEDLLHASGSQRANN